MDTSREKCTSQADPALLEAVRDIAAEEGRQFHVVLEAALAQLPGGGRPVSDVVHLTPAEAVASHEVRIEKFGGVTGVRHLGALKSAPLRPRTGSYRDVVEQAAALFESRVQNHPFIGGTTRVACAVMVVVLRMNGRVIEVDDIAAHEHLVGLMEQGALDLSSIDARLRGHVR